MLTVSTSSAKVRTSKGTLVLVGFIFVFLITSLAIGLKASSAALPVPAGRGCHGGEGEDAMITCTSSSSSTTTVSSSSTDSTTSSATSSAPTTSTTTTTTSTTTTLVSQVPVQSDAPVSSADCGALNGISYRVLAPGTQLTITINGNGQMTYTVPSEQSFNWSWYFVPSNGQSTTNLGQQITTAMWSTGHGQDFSFFVAKLNGQVGLVLQTDYALSQYCS